MRNYIEYAKKLGILALACVIILVIIVNWEGMDVDELGTNAYEPIEEDYNASCFRVCEYPKGQAVNWEGYYYDLRQNNYTFSRIVKIDFLRQFDTNELKLKECKCDYFEGRCRDGTDPRRVCFFESFDMSLKIYSTNSCTGIREYSFKNNIINVNEILTPEFLSVLNNATLWKNSDDGGLWHRFTGPATGGTYLNITLTHDSFDITIKTICP